MGNQKPYIEGQTIQWAKEKWQTVTYKRLHRLSNTNPTKKGDEPRDSKQFLLHWGHPSCYSCYKPEDKSWMKKGSDCDLYTTIFLNPIIWLLVSILLMRVSIIILETSPQIGLAWLPSCIILKLKIKNVDILFNARCTHVRFGKKLHLFVVDIFNSNLGRLFSTCDKSMSRSTLLGDESVQERHSSIIGPWTKQCTGAPIMKMKHIFFVLVLPTNSVCKH